MPAKQKFLSSSDDMVNSVEIGEVIEVIGLVGRHFPGFGGIAVDYGTIAVNNIKDVAKANPFNRELFFPDLPDYIVHLRKANLSSWAFTQRLVDVLFDDIAPRFVYRKIKLFLLLSLVALSERKQSKKRGISQSIHTMIVCDGYNSIVPRMMRRMSELKRHEEWIHGLGQKKQPLFIIQDKRSNKETFIESTILAGSRDGILLVDLDSLMMSKSSKLSLQNQHHTISIDPNTCCWGWSVTKPFVGNGGIDRQGPIEGIYSICNDPIRPVIDTFDLVVHLKEVIESEACNLLLDHLLDEAMSGIQNNRSPNYGLSFDGLKKYISVASGIEVKLSTECKDLLRKYFLITRKLKGASQGFASSTALLEQVVIPKQLNALPKYKLLYMKLCLRSVGSIDDALVSILMVEETLVSKYGSSASILGFVSLPDDGENLHKLYADQNYVDTNSLCDFNTTRKRSTDNDESEFISYLQHVSKIDEEEMVKMYQHLMRVLRSFYNENGVNDSISDCGSCSELDESEDEM
ncbi:5875_t:CDS:10 [Acaulospora morrowiae]|uniref:5875_t:CDS:1 n=1 Tax=Acaulospora morrowiae TaxID=94023 RepID=A0A9N9BNC4_9GLOM|nr:5875_t:CDS:10 [Acaulospora morrowiae]